MKTFLCTNTTCHNHDQEQTFNSNLRYRVCKLCNAPMQEVQTKHPAKIMAEVTEEIGVKIITPEDKKKEYYKQYQASRNKSRSMDNRNQHWRI